MERSQNTSPTMVVWDLGGVLAPSGSAPAALAEALDVPESQLAAPYWTHRDAYDLGASPETYWRLVADALGRPLDGAWVDRLDRIDTGYWATLASDAAALLARLTERGTPLGILSNAPGSLARAVRRAPWSTRFEALVFSSDLGLMKPDPLVYRAADERLGRAPSEVVFFDDRPENVAAAGAHGWRAHVWTGAEAAAAVLAREGVLDD
ncbi:HAD-IA family hydrolase [Streptomyces coeruleorubidus]|uniref:HAD-IA family hydrolase n=1 Tax=Streptomyces coeruleorubidus TaxID=116188 RepID=UPI00237F7A2A|nr:HAD-IA family hydrolase [Streptomyces coeruleorubidus]WDV56469.1 HAD-IA family hydrolase [Streptomyces coeruleorubidus]